jgi:hypothetical protein
VDAIGSHREASAPAHPVTWLSGDIVTLLNKIGAVIWLAALTGVFSAVIFKTGRLSVVPAFRPLLVFIILATVFIVWLSIHVQRVGYAGRDLIVSNYSRKERIPFGQVEAVGPVWWYYRRMVRIRLRSNSSFGQVLYYIPKWAAFKCLWVRPEKELQDLLAADPDRPPVYPQR